MKVVAGIDLGGTAVNYTIVNPQEQFLIEGLCEHPARSTEGPDVCLRQIGDGLKIAVERAGLQLDRTGAVELQPGRDDRRRHAALPGHRQLRLPLPGAPDRAGRARILHARNGSAGENPFFPSVYFRNLLYLDSVTHDPPGPRLAQAYVDYAWQHLRLRQRPVRRRLARPPAQLLVQAAIVQIYALLSSPPEHLLLRAPVRVVSRRERRDSEPDDGRGPRGAARRTGGARGRGPARDRRSHQDRARVGRSEGEQRVPRRQERPGAPRDEDRAAAREDRRCGRRRGGARRAGGVVGFGSTVVVRDEDGVEQTWQIVSSRDASPRDGRLSAESPVAVALLGRAPGDQTVGVAAPRHAHADGRSASAEPRARQALGAADTAYELLRTRPVEALALL